MSSSSYLYHFNSQPHKEADNFTPVLLSFDSGISTHSLTRRLTLRSWKLFVQRLYFNSQPHKEADVIWTYAASFFWNFNSQPHKEADNFTPVLLSFDSGISTHSLTRRLTREWSNSDDSNLFQLTASQGGWPWISAGRRSPEYFNSQPHKEADGNYVKKYDLSGISTHSLTRRLTSFNCHIFYLLLFQLTASQGGWQQDLDRKSYLLQISTHSLTRRLTLWIMPFLSRTLFQLTASQGGWLIFATCLQFLINYFNSQPHKEADLVWHRLRGIYPYFNSQPHKEADNIWIWRCYPLSISTHSLTRRLTSMLIL